MLTRRCFIKLQAAVGFATLPLLSACTFGGANEPAIELIPGKNLYAIWYSCEGGESGGYERVELIRNERGAAALSWSSKEWYDAREKRGKKTLDGSTFDEFEHLVEDYDLRAASEQPDSGLVALDADTSSITFAYVDEDGDMDADNMFSIDVWQELTDEQRKGFWAAIEALKALES